MGLGPQRKDSKTFGTTVYGLTHPTGLGSAKFVSDGYFWTYLQEPKQLSAI